MISTPPSIAFFTATPSSLTSAGGLVALSAGVANATSCTFTSNRPVAGLPATTPCTTGVVNESVTVPPNIGLKALTYRFSLAITGSRTMRSRIEVAVASGYHILPGSQWTLVEYPPFAPSNCSVQTFVSRRAWVDDFGHSGSFSGGAQTLQEPANFRGLFILSANWDAAANEYIGTVGDASTFIGVSLSPGPTPGC